MIYFAAVNHRYYFLVRKVQHLDIFGRVEILRGRFDASCRKIKIQMIVYYGRIDGKLF